MAAGAGVGLAGTLAFGYFGPAAVGTAIVEEGVDMAVEAATGVPMVTSVKDVAQLGVKTVRKALTKKADDVVESAGKATIYHGESSGTRIGHFAIQVDHNGKVMMTDQIITKSDMTRTTIQQTSPELNWINSATIDVPNAKGGLDYMQSVVGKELGPYDPKCNSCTSHVADVLRASGVDIERSYGAEVKALLRIVKKE